MVTSMGLMVILRKVLSISLGLFTDEVLETMETCLGGQTSTEALNDKSLPEVVKTSYRSWLCSEQSKDSELVTNTHISLWHGGFYRRLQGRHQVENVCASIMSQDWQSRHHQYFSFEDREAWFRNYKWCVIGVLSTCILNTCLPWMEFLSVEEATQNYIYLYVNYMCVHIIIGCCSEVKDMGAARLYKN